MQRREVRQPAVGEQPLERRDARGVELKDADHALAGLAAATRRAPRRPRRITARAVGGAREQAGLPAADRRGEGRRAGRAATPTSGWAGPAGGRERRPRPAGAAAASRRPPRARGRVTRSRYGRSVAQPIRARPRAVVELELGPRRARSARARTAPPSTPVSRARGRRGAARGRAGLVATRQRPPRARAGSRARARARARPRPASGRAARALLEAAVEADPRRRRSAASRCGPATSGAGGFSTRRREPGRGRELRPGAGARPAGWRSTSASSRPRRRSSPREPCARGALAARRRRRDRSRRPATGSATATSSTLVEPGERGQVAALGEPPAADDPEPQRLQALTGVPRPRAERVGDRGRRGSARPRSGGGGVQRHAGQRQRGAPRARAARRSRG